MASEAANEFMGPKLRALPNDRMRRFAVLMGAGETNASQAAREAGYSDHLEAAKVRAHYLLHDPKVREAIEEVASGELASLAPIAIRAVKDILADSKHRHYFRTIEAVLDRTGFAARMEHRVTVEHKADLRELEELARRLAVENGIAPERFVGLNGPVTIEGEVVKGEGDG